MKHGPATIVGNPAFEGNTMTLTFSNVSNAQWLTVEVEGITNAGGGILDSTEVNFGYLVGDIDASGIVNSTDTVITKFWSSSLPVSQGNFRADTDASGAVNSTDILYTKYLSSTFLP